MKLPQIAVVLNWRNEVNKSNHYSIHFRITIDRISKYAKVPLPSKVSPEQWTGKDDGWVKNHPFAFEINNKIIEMKHLLNDLIKRCYNLNKTVTFDMVFQTLKRKGDAKSFYEYMKNFIASPPEKLEINTIKKYNTCLSHLKRFRSELYFSDIDNTLIRDFNKFMQIDLDLIGSSCKKYLEAFKRVIKSARKEGLLDASQMEFLFDDVKNRVEKPKRTYLEPTEIKLWKNASIPADLPHLKRDRDLFLFQIYTGYYYKDLQCFYSDQLMVDEEFGYVIIGARDKNGNQTIIPLFKFPHAAHILKMYRSMDGGETVFSQSLFIEEPAYNRNLKEIAKLAGISKGVSNKVARHTNGQLWVRYGAQLPVISKMMGHTKEETTKNYFDVNIPEIVEGTKRVNFAKLGI